MTKKIVVFMLVVISVMSLLVVTAFATQSTPYGSYNTSRIGTQVGKAVIYKCSCNPVDNYLYAACKMQYKSGTSYLTTSWHSGYSRDTTGHQATWTTSVGTVNYVWGKFKAQCSGGSVVEKEKNASYNVS